MEEKKVDLYALSYLKYLIDFYQRKQESLYLLIETSYAAFLDYVNVKEFLSHLKLLYYKLTNKEIDNEPKQSK